MTDFIKPRLYLITPPVTEAEAFAPILKAAMEAGDVACVLLRFGPPDEGTRKKIVKALAPIVQARNAALLVEGDAQLAARAGADGAHVAQGGDQLDAALESLKPDRIVGVGGIEDKDQAMEAGERDVDYLLFGDLEPGGLPAGDVLEWTSWWAEIFNVPCVGVAHEPAEVAALATSGAEFVALGPSFFADVAAIGAAQDALDRAEASA